MSTAVAVVGALAAACMFGISSVLMFRAASQRRLWWAAAGLQALSFGVQALALAFGPLALVQPIAATDLLFALPFLARWQGRRLNGRDWAGAGVVALGVGTFVGISPPHAGAPRERRCWPWGVPSTSAWSMH